MPIVIGEAWTGGYFGSADLSLQATGRLSQAPMRGSTSIAVQQQASLTGLFAGGVAHGASYQITGTGFGTKSPAAPLLFDDMNHGQSYGTRWAGGKPVTGDQYAIGYYDSTVISPDGPPHSNSGDTVIAGCHASKSGNAYNDVFPSSAHVWSDPQPIYCHHLMRFSSAWDFTDPAGSNFDRNLKLHTWDLSPNSFSYGADYYQFVNMGQEPGNPPTLNRRYGSHLLSAEWRQRPDELGNEDGWQRRPSSPSPFQGWIAHEVFQNFSLTSSVGFGYIVRDNKNATNPGSGTPPTQGQMRLPSMSADKPAAYYHGRMGLTSMSNGQSFYNQWGGYARDRGTTNWRMYKDFYIDNTWSRVMFANNSDYDSATITVPQPPTAWSDTSITVTVNKGMLSSGTNHVFVFDSSNNRQYIGTVELA